MRSFDLCRDVKPFLKGCSFEFSTFSEGQFGSIERVELEKIGKIGTIDFWSEGWVGIDVYDRLKGEQVINLLISPEESGELERAFLVLIDIFMGA